MSPLPTTTTSASTPEPESERILDDTPVEVAVIGSGVCGVLAAAELRRRDGARVKVLEASPEGAGGVWRTTANHYSTLQAYAHLYEWDSQKRIDPNPWARARADSVLSAVTKYARETGVAAATLRGARVTAVTECFASTAEEKRPGAVSGGFFVDYELDVGAAAREQAGRLRAQGIGKKSEGGGEAAAAAAPGEKRVAAVVERRRLRASTVIVATGTLGRPLTPEERGLPSTKPFKGVVCNACRHEEEWNDGNGNSNKKGASSSSSPSSSSPSPLAEGAPAVAGKRVVILGSGAFALEAAERAALCGAESVTIVCRPHEHWVVPFSRQLLFVLLVTVLLPRAWAYALARFFARSFYKAAGIERLAPPLLGTGPQLFRGQCCDGWFFLQRSGLLRVTTEKVSAFSESGVVLEKEGEVEADILVVALGHKLNWAPPFLASLPSNSDSAPPSSKKDDKNAAAAPGTTLGDLHNFTFLGRRPRVATICDAVWFNVPHGPQAQIECFRSALAAVRAGPEAERLFAERALVASNWHGGTGEPLAPLWGASEADKRREAHIRSLAGGRGSLAESLSRLTLLSRRALLSVLLVLLALLEAARNAGWQERGARRALEANRRAKEEHCGRSGGSGGSAGASAASSKKGDNKSSKEATASAEVRIGGGGGGGAVVEGKKKA